MHKKNLLPQTLFFLTCYLFLSSHTAAVPAFAEQPVYQSESFYLDKSFHHYAVVLPTHPGKVNPVVLFLHGSGERGEDLDLATSVAVPILSKQLPNALIVVPQVKKDNYWGDEHYMALALASLQDVMQKYDIDHRRVYLTGLSMGGHGALRLAAAHPEKFAAVVAICPRLARPEQKPEDVDIAKVAQSLSQRLALTPLWLFHGELDPVTPAENSRALFAELEQKEAPAIYTELAAQGHNIWDTAYNDERLAEWLLDHELN